jgi:lipoprotein-anchoring transpeptidase ErfK/SrfK
MSGAGRRAEPPENHRAAEPAPGRPRSLNRLGVTAAAAAMVAVVTMVVAVLTVGTSPARAGDPGTAGVQASAPARPAVPARPSATAAPAGQAAARLTLTAADRRDCPAAATACVDLARHLTWLQSAGRVTFGPVPMEPGRPAGPHQTPRGTFKVRWKAGPGFVSDIYHEPMPWATFFAAGGIAFHGGSLTQWSHGCIHLTMASARYYNVHLPVGAVVVVF